MVSRKLRHAVEISKPLQYTVPAREGRNDGCGEILSCLQFDWSSANGLVIGIEHVHPIGHIQNARAIAARPCADLTKISTYELDVSGAMVEVQCLATSN